jgi:hypothetical protein
MYIEQKRKQHSMPMLTCVPTSNHPMLLCIRRSDEPAVRVAMNQAMTRQKNVFQTTQKTEETREKKSPGLPDFSRHKIPKRG